MRCFACWHATPRCKQLALKRQPFVAPAREALEREAIAAAGGAGKGANSNAVDVKGARVQAALALHAKLVGGQQGHAWKAAAAAKALNKNVALLRVRPHCHVLFSTCLHQCMAEGVFQAL